MQSQLPERRVEQWKGKGLSSIVRPTRVPWWSGSPSNGDQPLDFQYHYTQPGTVYANRSEVSR